MGRYDIYTYVDLDRLLNIDMLFYLYTIIYENNNDVYFLGTCTTCWLSPLPHVYFPRVDVSSNTRFPRCATVSLCGVSCRACLTMDKAYSPMHASPTSFVTHHTQQISKAEELNYSKPILNCITSRKQKACSCAPSKAGAAYAASGAWRA